MSRTVEFAVIGAGLSGAASALALAELGHEVVVLDRHLPGPSTGRDRGSERIYRHAYPDAFHTRMAGEADTMWAEAERRSGAQLITVTGSLDYGSARDAPRLAESMLEAGLAGELLDADEAQRRWPQFRFDSPVLWDPAAGVLDADLAARTMVGLAVEAGATLRADWHLRRVDEVAGGLRILSASGESVVARHVVVAPGSSINAVLARMPLPRPFVESFPEIELRQEHAFHFAYRPEFDSGAPWPSFVSMHPGLGVYGLGRHPIGGTRAQKLAEFGDGSLHRTPGGRPLQTDPHRERMVEHVRRSLPGLEPEPVAEVTYTFTYTPNEDFIIDRVDGITVVSPCSGHGAKFAPVVGRIAAELATGRGAPDSRFALPHPPAGS